MHIALTPEQEALRAELREYFAALVTPERRAALAASTSDFERRRRRWRVRRRRAYKDVIREIGHDGWLGIGWPEE